MKSYKHVTPCILIFALSVILSLSGVAPGTKRKSNLRHSWAPLRLVRRSVSSSNLFAEVGRYLMAAT